MSVTLRPYQEDAILRIRELMQFGCRSILYQGSTGSGKTALTAHMLKTASSKGHSSWFIVHRRELIEQSAKAFQLEGLKYGIIGSGYPANKQPLVQIASIQTLTKRFTRYQTPQLIVWDECHHIASNSWDKIFSSFTNSYHIGLSATPQRLDGRGLSTYFKEMIHGPSVAWLIENKFLSPYKIYAPSHVNLEGVQTQMGDYARGQLSQVMDKPKITGSAIEHYKKYANGKRAIVFAVSVEHSKHIVEEFKKGGINAEHIDGKTSSEERSRTIKDFVSGNIQVLSNVELFGEGFDVPGIQAIILLRPTKSVGLYLQQIGRCLRPAEGKPFAVILDHVGNCERFGLPDDERIWSLEGRQKSTKEFVPPIRVCQMCFAAQKPSPKCFSCGYVFPVVSREVTQVAGDLQEVNQAQLALKLRWRRSQGMAGGYKELVELGKSRGFKQPEKWAAIIMKARAAKKLKENA